MANTVPVTKERHGNKFWRRFSSYSFAANDCIAPLAAAEIPRAALIMPLAFVKQEGRYFLAGLMSPVPGENFFVDANGRWLGEYVPSCYRGYPFCLNTMQGENKIVLCVDDSSGLVSDEAGEPFMNGNGEISVALKAVWDFLTKVMQNRAATDRAVATLAEAGLIVQWPFAVTLGEQQKQVSGLYKIDEAGLNTIADGTFLALRKSGALPIALAQLLSMGNTRIFQKLAEIRAHSKKPSAHELHKILGEDDIFKF